MTGPADEFYEAQEAPISLPEDQAYDDQWRWQEVARLNGQHPRWVVLWHRETSEFRAYGRLPGARRDTALTASTPTRLAALITQVEQAGGRAIARPYDDP
jgi:hypothetical protein